MERLREVTRFRFLGSRTFSSFSGPLKRKNTAIILSYAKSTRPELEDYSLKAGRWAWSL